MPIFDYKCNKCGAIREFITTIPELNVPKDNICPNCGEGKLEKLFSARGQGFNINGYCYDNEYGKKALHRKSLQERTEIALGEDPY